MHIVLYTHILYNVMSILSIMLHAYMLCWIIYIFRWTESMLKWNVPWKFEYEILCSYALFLFIILRPARTLRFILNCFNKSSAIYGPCPSVLASIPSNIGSVLAQYLADFKSRWNKYLEWNAYININVNVNNYYITFLC